MLVNRITGFNRESDLTVSYNVTLLNGDRIRNVIQTDLYDKYGISERQRARYMNRQHAYVIVMWSRRSHQMSIRWSNNNNVNQEPSIVVMDDEFNLRGYGITIQQRKSFIKKCEIEEHQHTVTTYNNWDGCDAISMLQINNRLKAIKADGH